MRHYLSMKMNVQSTNEKFNALTYFFAVFGLLITLTACSGSDTSTQLLDPNDPNKGTLSWIDDSQWKLQCKQSQFDYTYLGNITLEEIRKSNSNTCKELANNLYSDTLFSGKTLLTNIIYGEVLAYVWANPDQEPCENILMFKMAQKGKIEVNKRAEQVAEWVSNTNQDISEVKPGDDAWSDLNRLLQDSESWYEVKGQQTEIWHFLNQKARAIQEELKKNPEIKEICKFSQKDLIWEQSNLL